MLKDGEPGKCVKAKLNDIEIEEITGLSVQYRVIGEPTTFVISTRQYLSLPHNVGSELFLAVNHGAGWTEYKVDRAIVNIDTDLVDPYRPQIQYTLETSERTR